MINVLPTVADVADAYVRLRDWVVETPVLESEALNRRIGTRVLFKAECLQHGGSFKIRGALNRILQLSHAERSAGVVAFSSGNHAQAVALAAQWLGIRATIVMPADAPQTKLAGTRSYGAEVVLYDRERENREQIASDIAAQRGAALVPPFDHAQVVAGQGTAALELGRTRARAPCRARCALRAVQRRRARGGLGARDQVRVRELRGVRRGARGLYGHGGVARRGRATHARSASADDLRWTACAGAGRDHVRDQPPRARRRRRRRRRRGARSDGARGRAPEARRRAVRRGRARCARAAAAARRASASA